ncbi:uncharacterized protein LOC143222183 isoform X2 [Tachypleus tridentatus]|uniref:uncharacterized protein LOC143222183 isoform X2 n=1 Tax=Tachypleus tridentatus TaxID=6853 RepID=UPI003FD536FA
MDFNRESVLDELNKFEKKRPPNIPMPLEEFLRRIAKTGDIAFPWSKLKPLLRRKLENVMDDFYEAYPTEDLPPLPNVEGFHFDTMRKRLLDILDSFNSAPFTVQRLCELLTNPQKHYHRTDKFMRGLEKNILVVSTIQPTPQHWHTEANNSVMVNGIVNIVNGRDNNSNLVLHTNRSAGVDESQVDSFTIGTVLPPVSVGLGTMTSTKRGEDRLAVPLHKEKSDTSETLYSAEKHVDSSMDISADKTEIASTESLSSPLRNISDTIPEHSAVGETIVFEDLPLGNSADIVKEKTISPPAVGTQPNQMEQEAAEHLCVKDKHNHDEVVESEMSEQNNITDLCNEDVQQVGDDTGTLLHTEEKNFNREKEKMSNKQEQESMDMEGEEMKVSEFKKETEVSSEESKDKTPSVACSTVSSEEPMEQD